MRITIVCAMMLAAAGVQFTTAQVTARQIWYQDDPAPKQQTAVKPPPAPEPPAPRVKRPKKSTPQPAPTGTGTETLTASLIPVMEVSSKPLGIRYSLLRISDEAPVEVSPKSTFRSGDFVRVRVEANRDGFLYVASQGSSGKWKLLFPSLEIADGDNHIQGHRSYDLPAGDEAFHFDDRAGEERLVLFYSAQPVNNLDTLIYSLSRSGKPEASEPKMMAKDIELENALISRLEETRSRDLVVDRVPSGFKQYVASESGAPVIADILLKHE